MRTGCGSFARKKALGMSSTHYRKSGDKIPIELWDENGIDKALCLELRNPALKNHFIEAPRASQTTDENHYFAACCNGKKYALSFWNEVASPHV